MAKKRVLVAMSGGVDSSVAAYLLKKEGFEVAGVTMCFGIKESGKKKPTCCGAQAMNDAKKVCLKLGIPHYALDFSGHLEEKVIDNFISAYLNGRTPNPCVECNRELKFGILLGKALGLGFDFLATGHYARIVKERKDFILKRAKDKNKDQSYFLYSIRPEALKSVLFPLGNLTKDEVREIAKDAGLPVHDKPGSQDICFIQDRNYHGFLSDRVETKASPGAIVHVDGTFLGNHKGASFFTIGQRGGLGVGYRHPLYVLSIDAEKNQLVVGEKKGLKSKGLVAGFVNLLVRKLPKKVFAKIRYNQDGTRGAASFHEESAKLEVRFDKPVEAVTPGQSVVLYSEDTVLGGGIIERSLGG